MAQELTSVEENRAVRVTLAGDISTDEQQRLVLMVRQQQQQQRQVAIVDVENHQQRQKVQHQHRPRPGVNQRVQRYTFLNDATLYRCEGNCNTLYMVVKRTTQQLYWHIYFAVNKILISI